MSMLSIKKVLTKILTDLKDIHTSLSAKSASGVITSGVISDIHETGVYYIGGSVTGKPPGITPGGLLICTYVDSDNHAYIFFPQTTASTGYIYKKTGGTVVAWTAI